jgi:hypothetical protein
MCSFNESDSSYLIYKFESVAVPREATWFVTRDSGAKHRAAKYPH